MYWLMLLVSARIVAMICEFEWLAVTVFGFECCDLTAFLTALVEVGSGDLAGARRADGLAGALSNSMHPYKSVGLFDIFR